MSTFRDLLIWQKSMALVTEIYQLTNLFPKEEIYGLTSNFTNSKKFNINTKQYCRRLWQRWE